MSWPDGTVRWIEAHGKVTTDEQGNPTGTIGCVRDITDRVTVQEREADAAARALLLQEVTAAFFRAWTLDQVEAVLAASLERVGEILRDGVELRVPEDLSTVTDGAAFVASTRRPLSHEDSQLLDTLAAQCAIAAQRAELQARTADIAEQLQSSLAASPLPALDRFDLAVHYAPGGDELEHVGGDWYDAVRTPSGTLALVVGDVMGRGVRAATTMIRVRAGIRGLLTVDPAPRAVLTAADEMMTRDAPDQFVTAVAVLVDPDDGDAHPLQRRSRAGRRGAPGRHAPRRSATGRACRWACRAASTGPWPPPGSSPGTLLVLVTDGVVESRAQTSTRASPGCASAPSSCGTGRSASWSTRWPTSPTQSLRDDVTVVAARLK